MIDKIRELLEIIEFSTDSLNLRRDSQVSCAHSIKQLINEHYPNLPIVGEYTDSDQNVKFTFKIGCYKGKTVISVTCKACVGRSVRFRASTKETVLSNIKKQLEIDKARRSKKNILSG